MHYIVTGHVQGVFYRSAAQTKARALAITGWIKNTNGGNVEIIACGEQANIQLFEKWLWQGPRLAKVTSVKNKLLPWQEHNDFVIQYHEVS